MAPESAKSFPGPRPVRARPSSEAPLAERARQEIDYARRGKGDILGAFPPASGEAFTVPYRGRTIANGVYCLEQGEAWLPPESERIYAIVENWNVHRATDVLLFALAHPRWEFVFQPKDAAHLNLIEAWWKPLRALAFKGRRFARRDDLAQVVYVATEYWNAHRHPFVRGRWRRHQPRRRAALALFPKAA